MKSKIILSTIISFLCFSLSTIGIMGATPEKKKELKDDSVVVKSNVEEMTVETTATPETTTEEETTKKPKKLKSINIGGQDDFDDEDSGSKKKSNNNNFDNNFDNGFDDTGFDDTGFDDSSDSSGGAINNYYYNGGSSSKKKHKTTKKRSGGSNSGSSNYSQPKPKKKAIKNQSESNALSSKKINLLRSQIKSKIKGSQNKEMTNLAKYMARKGLSNASNAYQKLTNVSGSVSCATYKLKVSTNDQLDILDAANKVHELKAGKFGIGICSTQASVGYKIYVVICYR